MNNTSNHAGNHVITIIDNTLDALARPTLNIQTKQRMGMHVINNISLNSAYYERRAHYKRTSQPIVSTHVETIQPRKFYDKTSLISFIDYIKDIANRDVETDEITLLLRYITNGKRYELVVVDNVNDTQETHNIWHDTRTQ